LSELFYIANLLPLHHWRGSKLAI